MSFWCSLGSSSQIIANLGESNECGTPVLGAETKSTVSLNVSIVPATWQCLRVVAGHNASFYFQREWGDKC